MRHLADTIKYKGIDIEISIDEDAESTREWDNMGTMICFHKGYNLGDKTDLKSDDFEGWIELEKYLIKECKAKIIFPLYLYDHSGITISTSPFSCRWDSGQVGFIYATAKDIKENYQVKKITAKIIKRAKELLQGEVEEYDSYIRGEVYNYSVDEFSLSCCGYYGSDFEASGLLPAVRNEIDNALAERNKKKETKLKAFIKNKVALEKREGILQAV